MLDRLEIICRRIERKESVEGVRDGVGRSAEQKPDVLKLGSSEAWKLGSF
jgi:hypothetical protein